MYSLINILVWFLIFEYWLWIAFFDIIYKYLNVKWNFNEIFAIYTCWDAINISWLANSNLYCDTVFRASVK